MKTSKTITFLFLICTAQSFAACSTSEGFGSGLTSRSTQSESRLLKGGESTKSTSEKHPSEKRTLDGTGGTGN